MTGLLLVNTGTPASPEVRDVRRYLRAFLSDPRVIDLPAPARWLLLHCLILPLRPRRSAAAYRLVWTDRGSPLLVHADELAAALRTSLGDGVVVEVAMRYGEPSIAAALDRLEAAGATGLTLLPLFPHYASATRGTVVAEVFRQLGARTNIPALRVVPPFYADPGFVRAVADQGRPLLAEVGPERVLFSFHGLPERHCTQGSPEHPCLADPTCCDRLVATNAFCYRAQCFATARAVAAELELAPDAWEVTFQSRLAGSTWIRPYTDVRIRSLAQQGVRRVVVFCPAFVADCLETLEEIGLRAASGFVAAGGEALHLVPSLNASEAWVDCIVRLVSDAAVDDPPERSEWTRAS